LLASGERQAAESLRRLAAARLALVLSLAVAFGVIAAPGLVWLLAPGFDPDRAALATLLVRILFPAAGLLVMSALALAVLQAQGRFLSGYASPILWNGAIVLALLVVPVLAPRASEALLAEAVAAGAAVGALLQWGWQVWRTRTVVDTVADAPDEGYRLTAAAAWKRCLGAFPPVLASRGVVQISAWVDTALASLLPVGSLAIMAYAQALYLLPIALFGTSISAATLPALAALRQVAEPGAGRTPREAGTAAFRTLLERSERHLMLLGGLATGAGVLFASNVVGLVYGGGRFDAGVVANTSIVLACGMSIVLPSMLGRLYANAFFALEQATVATRAALLRVTVSITLSLLAVWLLDLRNAEGPAVCGWLLLASGVGATAEAAFLLNRLAGGHLAMRLRSRMGSLGLVALAVAVGTVAGKASGSLLAQGTLAELAALGAYGAGFIATLALLGKTEDRALLASVLRRVAGQR
jgi:putative peptidoglycan lipid II flippase